MIRFLSLSLLFHLLLLAPIYLLLKPRNETAVAPPLQLSEGEVFVGKNPIVDSASVPATPQPNHSQTDFTSAAEVNSGTSAAGGALGVPDGEAKPREGIKLAYPVLSARLGEAGKVSIGFDISSSGQAENAKVIHSSGFARLDRAAIETLTRASYLPAIVQGAAVASHKEITVDFRLNSAGKAPKIEIGSGK